MVCKLLPSFPKGTVLGTSFLSTSIMCAVAVVCILSAFSFGFLKRNGPLTAVKIVSKRRKGKGFLSTLLEAFTTTILVGLLRGTCKYAQEAIY